MNISDKLRELLAIQRGNLFYEVDIEKHEKNDVKR